MTQWITSGIQKEIKTTPYPEGVDSSPGITPGRPTGQQFSPQEAVKIVERCPVQALSQVDGKIIVDYRKCIHCYRCQRDIEPVLNWEKTYEWGAISNEKNSLPGPFQRSNHILVLDTGDCGACLNEVQQLNNPYYNMHRLGFFITPTPRHADILLIVGPVTDRMIDALHKVYDAMPTPKKVIAVGTCALSGGVFAESFACPKRLSDIVPVDVEVPGQPPPPLAILHGLLVAVGRKPSSELTSSEMGT
jgi:Ni,Fe-hydrogenase III small subunit/ferredoxin-like protein FixX